MKPGFYRMSNAEYHGHKDILSSSGAVKLLQSPAHFRAYIDGEKEDSAALSVGSAFHSLVLEEDKFSKQCAIAPPELKTRGSKKWDAFKAEAEGKITITTKEASVILSMTDSLWENLRALRLLRGKVGVAELSGFWQDERGFWCRIRPDFLPGNGICVDLKTTKDASPAGFPRSCAKYGYHISAAMYLDGLTRLTGKEHHTFIFIAVEKKPPYAVGVYYASEAMIEKGRRDLEKAYDLYAQCTESNEWPAYSEEAQEINLPMWAS